MHAMDWIGNSVAIASQVQQKKKLQMTKCIHRTSTQILKSELSSQTLGKFWRLDCFIVSIYPPPLYVFSVFSFSSCRTFFMCELKLITDRIQFFFSVDALQN